MRKDDIRFNGRNVTLKHHSARGRVTRNAGDFTRGSQLVTHEFLMTFAGIRIPLIAWLLGPESGFVTGAEFVTDGGMTRKMIYTE